MCVCVVSVICACVCVCQDNDPGTRNLEFGHTVVKMKYAASGGLEGSDDARLETQSSVRGPRETHMGRRVERRQHTGREMTVASMRGEVVKGANKSACGRMYVCMYVCDVGTYVSVTWQMWTARTLDGCIFGRVTSREGNKHMLGRACACACHCTCNPGDFSWQLGWSASSGRISTADQDRDGV